MLSKLKNIIDARATKTNSSSSGSPNVTVEPAIELTPTINITASKGDTGDTGPQGPQGAQGIQGIQGISGIVTAKQSAQVTNSSSTTLSDVTGLSFSLTANHRYYFNFTMTFQTAATTTGIAFAFTGPNTTFVNWKVKIQQAAFGTDTYYEGQALALSTVLVSTGVVASNTDYYAEVEGIIEPSGNGTLQLQTRSEVNASQITIKNQGTGFLVDMG